MEDSLAFLQSTELLSKVPKDRLVEIAAYFQPVSIPAGAVIFREGDAGDALYMVGEGQVRVERDSIPVAIRRSGDCIGEMALLDQSPRSSTLVAQTDTASFGCRRRILRASPLPARKSPPESTAFLPPNCGKTCPKGNPTPPDEPTRVIADSEKTPGLLLPAHLEGITFAGRYRIQAMLGRGGMAYVYRADDRLLGVPVAVKILHRIGNGPSLTGLSRRSSWRERWSTAMSAGFSTSGSPRDCPIFDGLIEGITLTDKIRVSGRLSLADALPILRRSCRRCRKCTGWGSCTGTSNRTTSCSGRPAGP